MIVADAIRNETELIQTYLAPLTAGAPGACNLTDDAALLPIEPTADLVVTTDPIIAGVHFFADDRPEDIAWKALAVNVSDLAAKGATPVAYTLALAFPAAPERAWMAGFARGLAEAQAAFGFHLIGGDTDRTPGPLSIGVTAFGATPKGAMVKRQGAAPGDVIFVTGSIGDAALGLDLRRGAATFKPALSATDVDYLIDRYLRPQPRLSLTLALRAHARAALDVSDGLAQDLGRLVEGLGADVAFEKVPLSDAGRRALAFDPRLTERIVGGGDDYEVLGAAPVERADQLVAAARSAGVTIALIGVVSEAPGVRISDSDGAQITPKRRGYDHFSG